MLGRQPTRSGVPFAGARVGDSFNALWTSCAIVPSEKTAPIDLVVGTKADVRAHPDLALACSDERAIARATAGTRLAARD
jgi:hypothetical protein